MVDSYFVEYFLSFPVKTGTTEVVPVGFSRSSFSYRTN